MPFYAQSVFLDTEKPQASNRAAASLPSFVGFFSGPGIGIGGIADYERGEMSVHVLSSTSRIEMSFSEPVVQMLALRPELPALFEESASFPTFPRR